MSMPYVIIPPTGSDPVDEWLKLGVTAHSQGNLPLAQQHYGQALRIDPNNAAATQNLAVLYAQSNLLMEALSTVERATMFDSKMALLYTNMAYIALQCERIEESLNAAKMAVDLEATAHTKLALAMVYTTAGMPELSVPLYEQILAEQPTHPVAGPNICFIQTLMPCTPKELREKRDMWHRNFGYKGVVAPHANDKNPSRPLRIGYVSGDFKTHSAAMIFKPAVMQQSEGLQTYLYSTLPVSDTDANTVEFKAFAGERWRDISMLNDEQADALIRQDKIDILVDLAGHTNGGRLVLFTRKPAPIQVTAWGFAHGTGCPEIDYFFADPIAVPAHEREHYAEKIYDLPCIVSYAKPAYDLKGISKLPYWANDYVTFGTYARYEKMNDECLRMFAEILKQVPGSKLQFKDHGCRRPYSVKRTRAVMHDIDPNRLLFSMATSHPEHMQSYQQADLILDPYPHSGGVVCLEQMYMGTPMVTRYGTQAAGRTSSSVLAVLGKVEWIARSHEEYVEKAVKMVSNPATLAKYRKTLREEFMQSPVVKDYGAAVEKAYRDIWETHCG